MSGVVEDWTTTTKQLDSLAGELDLKVDVREELRSYYGTLRHEFDIPPAESLKEASNNVRADLHNRYDLEEPLSIRTAPIPGYNVNSQQHQEVLGILDAERSRLEKEYAAKDPESYVDRTELRDALRIAELIREHAREGKAVSFDEITDVPFDPEDAPNYRGGRPWLARLPAKLEAAGYRFIPNEHEKQHLMSQEATPRNEVPGYEEFMRATTDRVAGDQAAERAWREEHRPAFEAAARDGVWAPDWARRDLKPAPEMTRKEIVGEVRELHAHFQDLNKQYEQQPARRAEIREEMQPVVNRERELRQEYSGRINPEISQDRVPEQRGIGY